jgi:type IV secretory pathway TrbL component
MRDKYDPDDLWAWYFTPGVRMVLTIPILLIFVLNTLWYFLLIFMVEIDFLLWNILFFIFLGLTVGWIIAGIPAMISALAWAMLPQIWDGWKASAFAKMPAWLALAVVSVIIPSLIAGLGLDLLQWLGVPLRATGWWWNVFR